MTSIHDCELPGCDDYQEAISEVGTATIAHEATAENTPEREAAYSTLTAAIDRLTAIVDSHTAHEVMAAVKAAKKASK